MINLAFSHPRRTRNLVPGHPAGFYPVSQIVQNSRRIIDRHMPNLPCYSVLDKSWQSWHIVHAPTTESDTMRPRTDTTRIQAVLALHAARPATVAFLDARIAELQRVAELTLPATKEIT
jgi:hypothetical protein